MSTLRPWPRADAAVSRIHGGKKKTHLMEALAGEKSPKVHAPDLWLPGEILHAVRNCVVSIKRPHIGHRHPAGVEVTLGTVPKYSGKD